MNKIVKTIVLAAVLVIFALSIVQSVLAVEVSEETVVEFTEHSRNNGSRSAGITGAAASYDLIQKRSHEAKQAMNEKREVEKQIKLQAKSRLDQMKQRVHEARESYEQARDKYREAQDQYHEQKDRIMSIREKIKACAGNTEECIRHKSELKVGVKQHLLKTATLIERSLEKLMTRVEEQTTLTEQEKEEAILQINELEAQIAAQQDQIEALPENATAADYRKTIKDLKETWQNVRKEQKRIISVLISAKLDNLVEKHVEYGNAMQLRIEELNEKGVDTSALVKLQAEFHLKVSQLQEDHATAQQLWTEVKRGREVLEEWHTAELKVHQDLLGTKEILRKFLSVYKELKMEVSAEATVQDDSGAQASASS